MAATPASWFTLWLSSKSTFLHPPHPSILRIGRYCATVRFARKDPIDTTQNSYRLSSHWSSVGMLSTTSSQLESTMQTQASLQKINFSYFSWIGAYYLKASSPFIWLFYSSCRSLRLQISVATLIISLVFDVSSTSHLRRHYEGTDKNVTLLTLNC
jgi:hypothetical protein